MRCGETSDKSHGSPVDATATSVTVVVTMLIALPLGVLIGCCGYPIALGRRGTIKSGGSDGGSGDGSKKGEKEETVLYEEVEKSQAALTLHGNVAYGPVQR